MRKQEPEGNAPPSFSSQLAGPGPTDLSLAQTLLFSPPAFHFSLHGTWKSGVESGELLRFSSMLHCGEIGSQNKCFNKMVSGFSCSLGNPMEGTCLKSRKNSAIPDSSDALKT